MTEAAKRIQELEAALEKIRHPRIYTGAYYATVQVPERCPDCDGRDFISYGAKGMICHVCSLLQANEELRAALAQKTRECEDAKHSHQLAQAGWELTLKNLIDAQAQVEQLGRQVAELSKPVTPKDGLAEIWRDPD